MVLLDPFEAKCEETKTKIGEQTNDMRDEDDDRDDDAVDRFDS